MTIIAVLRQKLMFLDKFVICNNNSDSVVINVIDFHTVVDTRIKAKMVL